MSEVGREERRASTAVRRAGWIALRRTLATVGQERRLQAELGDMQAVGPAPSVAGGPRVLFVAPRYWSTHVLLQTALGQALAVRGARVSLATCGGAMPICEVDWKDVAPVAYCGRCATSVRDLADAAGVAHFAVAERLDAARVAAATAPLATLDLAGLLAVEFDGVPVGKFALVAARWRLRTHWVERHPQGREVLEGFVRAGIAWVEGMERILDAERPDVVVMLNGLFLPERVAATLARRRGTRLVFFERGRDAESMFFSHDVAAPRYDVSRAWEQVRDVPLSDEERQRVGQMMDRRARGEQVVEQYWTRTDPDERRIRAELGIAEEAPVAVLYTNVVWDTAMQDRDTIFDGMMDWLEEVVAHFRDRPEWTLVIRVHPAETQLAGRESYDRVADWLAENLPPLPGNVRVIAPDRPVDSYALMRMARLGLVYASTTGLELAVSGVPVIVAGDAHYSGKGLTYDPASREEFRATVDAVLRGEREGDRARMHDMAQRYAHLFFFRRTMKPGIVREPEYGWPRLGYASLDELRAGRSAALDALCDGILTGREFML